MITAFSGILTRILRPLGVSTGCMPPGIASRGSCTRYILASGRATTSRICCWLGVEGACVVVFIFTLALIPSVMGLLTDDDVDCDCGDGDDDDDSGLVV